jgi:hypothetical protein
MESRKIPNRTFRISDAFIVVKLYSRFTKHPLE